MLAAIVLALALSIATIFVHYETLRVLWMYAPRLLRRLGPRGLILTSVVGAFGAHALEIVVYALAYWSLEGRWGLGQVTEVPLSFMEALFFSTESYATLGIEAVAREVPMRLVVGTEAVTGLLLLTWSASFTYLVMRHGWRVERDEG